MRIAGVGNSTNIFDGQRRDFITMRKDTFEYTGTHQYITSEGIDAEYDFTGCIGAMAIKKKKKDTTTIRWVSVTFDETEYTLSVDAEDMDMDAGKYYYDMQIKDADGKMVTKMYGDFIVLQDITDFLDIMEEDYEHIFNSNVNIVTVPQEKFTIILSSSVLAEIISNASEYYTTMLGSSVNLAEVLKQVMTVTFSSKVSATLVNNYTTIAMLGSSVAITTYVNQDYIFMLGSSLEVSLYSEAEGTWRIVYES